MINWKDCIVPMTKAVPTRKTYIWIAYSETTPYLPIAIADTAEELSKIVGVSSSTIMACWNKYQQGIISKTRYHHIKVGYEKELE